MNSPSDDISSSGKRSRILVVEVKYANFLDKYKKSGDFYVKLWINEKRSLQTRLVHCTKHVSSPNWNQKFLFSVPHSFFSKNNNEEDGNNRYDLNFEIIHQRKFRSDSVLGCVRCQLGPVFPEIGKLDEIHMEEENPNYDTDEEISVGRESFASIFTDIEEDEDEDEDETHIHHAEKNEDEKIAIRYDLKKSGFLNVFKLKKESVWVKSGVLKVGLELWKDYIGLIGQSGWLQPIAMNYEEFMMETNQYNEENKKQKTSPLMCFGSLNTKD